MKDILKTVRKRIKGIVSQQKRMNIHTNMSKVAGIVAIVVFLLIAGSTITIA